jgi:ankyrin repeat protein
MLHSDDLVFEISSFIRIEELHELSLSDRNTHRAVQNALIALFALRFKINIQDTFIALPRSCLELERLLRRASPERDMDGFREAFFFACSAGYTEFVIESLETSSSDRRKTLLSLSKTGNYALTLAAENGRAAIVKHLLGAKADPNICDIRGFCATWYACVNGEFRVLKSLIDHHVKPHKSRNPLVALFQSGTCRPSTHLGFQLSTELVADWLIAYIKECFTDLDPFDQAHVRRAADALSIVLDGLAQSMASPRCHDLLILHFLDTIKDHDRAIFEYVRLNPFLFTREPPLYSAAANNKHKMIDPLIQSGISSLSDICPKTSKSALYVAAERGHTESVRALLQAGASISLLTSTGRNSLHAAVGRGHTHIVEILCQHASTADIMQMNSSQIPPFILAENKGRRQMVRAMLDCYQRTATETTMSAFLNSKIHQYSTLTKKPPSKRTV